MKLWVSEVTLRCLYKSHNTSCWLKYKEKDFRASSDTSSVQIYPTSFWVELFLLASLLSLWPSDKYTDLKGEVRGHNQNLYTLLSNLYVDNKRYTCKNHFFVHFQSIIHWVDIEELGGYKPNLNGFLTWPFSGHRSFIESTYSFTSSHVYRLNDTLKKRT